MKDTILFDLDGTLLNTLYDIAEAVNITMRGFGYPERSIEEIRTFVGNGADMLIKRALPENHKDNWQKVLDIYKDCYNSNLCCKTKPYEGIIELIDKLNQSDYKIGVVTNKPDAAAKTIIKHYFGNRITAVVGADVSKRKKKPEPDGVDYCLEILKSRRENTIYVGDSEVDVATAKNSGLVSIGVTWGFRDKEYLNGADYTADSCSELYDVILNI